MWRQVELGRRNLISVVSLISLLVALLAGTTLVQAGDSAKFGIRPATTGAENTKSGYFILKGEPGKTLRDAIVVANNGPTTLKLQVYAVDATTSQQGGAAYLNVGEPSREVGSWIKLEASEVEVAPNKQMTIPFTITIPSQVRGGQHLGGIAVQLADGADATASSGSPQAGFGITSLTRGLTAVLINVGEATGNASLRINGAQIIQVDGQPTLSLALQNDGNSLIKPKGEVSITNTSGKTIVTNQLALDTFVPQTSINYHLSLDQLTTAGTYNLHASLDFGGNAPAIFDGPLVIEAKPQAANKTASSATNPVATVVSSSAPALANNAVAISQASSDGNNGMLIPILLGVCATLLLVTVGLVGVVVRSRKRF